MNILRRLAVRVSPPHRQDWIEGHLAESDHIEGRLRKVIWTLGLLPFVVSVLITQMFRLPRSQAVDKAWTRVLVAFSLTMFIGGIALISIWLRTDQPLNIAIIGVATAALAVAAMLIERKGGTVRYPNLFKLATAVGAIAVVAGSVGLTLGAIRAAQAGADPEFGPMTVAALMALHGLVVIARFNNREEPEAPRT